MPVVHHIPVCPFSQRLEILLELKGCRDRVDFRVVDITRPRDPALLARTGGHTALPVLLADDGTVLRESLVILRYLEALFPQPRIAQPDPLRHAVEDLMCVQEGAFTAAGYRLVMNQDRARRDDLTQALLAQYAELDAFLCRHGGDGPFLFERFGWAEVVYTPIFMRYGFLGYYEDFELPDDARYARVRAWRDACLAHPAAQQVSREQIVKLYYDYAQGAGNGALLPGRMRSSFVFEPHWRARPWPPRAKYGAPASDAALGLL